MEVTHQALLIFVQENSYPGEILDEDILYLKLSKSGNPDRWLKMSDQEWKRRVESILSGWAHQGLIEREGETLFRLLDRSYSI